MLFKHRLQNVLNKIFPAQKRKIEEAEKMQSKTASRLFTRHQDLSARDQERMMRDKTYAAMINIGKREGEERHANH